MADVFAVIETGGKQYVVRAGDVLRVEKLADADGNPFENGAKIVFDKVLLVDDGNNTTVGTPYIKGAVVTASSMGDGRTKKITTLRYKSKVRVRRTEGHRQHFTKVKIEAIS